MVGNQGLRGGDRVDDSEGLLVWLRLQVETRDPYYGLRV